MAREWNSTSSTTGLLSRVLGSEPAIPLSSEATNSYVYDLLWMPRTHICDHRIVTNSYGQVKNAFEDVGDAKRVLREIRLLWVCICVYIYIKIHTNLYTHVYYIYGTTHLGMSVKPSGCCAKFNCCECVYIYTYLYKYIHIYIYTYVLYIWTTRSTMLVTPSGCCEIQLQWVIMYTYI